MKKHKNFKKAIELLPIRFQNCDLHEVSEKLYWDLQYVETDENPDDNSFGKVLLTAESLYSDVLDQMYKDGWIKDDEEDRL